MEARPEGPAPGNKGFVEAPAQHRQYHVTSHALKSIHVFRIWFLLGLQDRAAVASSYSLSAMQLQGLSMSFQQAWGRSKQSCTLANGCDNTAPQLHASMILVSHNKGVSEVQTTGRAGQCGSTGDLRRQGLLWVHLSPPCERLTSSQSLHTNTTYLR